MEEIDTRHKRHGRGTMADDYYNETAWQDWIEEDEYV